MEADQKLNDDFDYEKIQAILEEEERNKRKRREEEKRREEKDRYKRRDRSRDKERDRDYNRDRDRNRHRSRDDSRDRRHRDRRSHSRDRKREKEARNKEMVIMEKTIEEAKRQAVEAQRDDCTILIYRLHLDAREKDLFNFFMAAGIGKVVDIKVIRDPRTNRSKGAAYVEFASQDSVMLAVAMSGQQIMGQTVTIQHSQAEKNRLAAAAKYKKEMIKEQQRVNLRKPLEIAEPVEMPMKIYVGGLEQISDILESDLKNIFSPFGEIESIDMQRDQSTYKVKGYCYITYRKISQARAAISGMENFRYKGRLLKVGIAREEIRPNELFAIGADGDDSHLHTSQSKQALMQKLNRDLPLEMNPSLGRDATISGSINTTSTINTGFPSVTQSSCVLLSNLFDPSSVNIAEEPNFNRETKEDVMNECSNFGKVEEVYVDQSSTGNVWVKFANSNWQAARAAVEGLNGRWFASRPIKAHLVSEGVFDENVGNNK